MMPANKGIRKVCAAGHVFYKSSSCPVCPVCEKKKVPAGFPEGLSAPARRALENAGIKTLAALANLTEKNVLQLHGMGPASIPLLKAALKAKGLSFK